MSILSPTELLIVDDDQELRERGNDARLLTVKLSGPGWERQSSARAALKAYHWPGKFPESPAGEFYGRPVIGNHFRLGSTRS